MGARTIEIEVQNDHLERLAQVRKPVLAVAELIWNALDADATQVHVLLHDDALGELTAIEVTDNGHGMPYSDVETLFSRLGGSWKKGNKRSQERGRLLHGQEGRGRLRAFGLGRVVDWRVTYGSKTGPREYNLSMVKNTLRRVQIGEEIVAPTSDRRGVSVTVSELDRDFRSLRTENVKQEVAQIFALYLRQYPDVSIYFNHTQIESTSAVYQTKSSLYLLW